MKEEQPTETAADVQLKIETRCEWCWVEGLKAIDIETVQTFSGDAQRCIDRGACRARAESKLRNGPSTRPRPFVL